jgi:hypothetical protein
MRAISAGARIARRIRHARNSLASAFSEEYGDFALDFFPTAFTAGHGSICLGHGAQCIEFVIAILTNILINWHKHLYL